MSFDAVTVELENIISERVGKFGITYGRSLISHRGEFIMCDKLFKEAGVT